MKVRLLRDIPVAPEHGLKAGLVLDAERLEVKKGVRGQPYYRVRSLSTGEWVSLFRYEAEVVTEEMEDS